MNDRFKFRFYAVNYKTYVDATIGSFIGSDMIPIWKNGNFLTMEKTTDVIPEQCTGLKDKNGKLIYENDLIKIDDDVAVIKWSDYYARFMLESSEDNFDFETTYAEECEIVGNIHTENEE